MTEPDPLSASALTSDRVHLPASSLSRVNPRMREKAADRGEAMPDGSFPIRDGQDLKRAIRAFGRAKDKARAKRHIIRRARALGKVDLLPDKWRETASREFVPVKRELPLAQAQAQPNELREKIERYNQSVPKAQQVSVPKAQVVYNRGIKEFASAGLTGITPEQFAHARLNSFLRMLAFGEASTRDHDLLPVTHPLAS